jgi:dihydroneopterin aldolase
MMDTISLTGMQFYAHHGCFAEEQKIGTRFMVDVQLAADLSRAAASDELNDTLNYQEVYNIVKLEMEEPSHLLEHVAGRIATSLTQKMEKIAQLTVKVTKFNPPLGGQVQASSVSITRVGKSAIAQ